jgi:putative transposase
MLRETPLVTGESYHLYNRGAHKENIFTNKEDYFRFSLLLHLANSTGPMNLALLLAKYKGRSFLEIFREEKVDKGLVEIFAYCLMPNHFHIIVRQKIDNGVALFMKKLLTAYSMYFNTKYAHSGVLFQGRFKSRHISDNEYFRYLFAYVHLNPFDIFEAAWKERGFTNSQQAREFLHAYPYSSFIDYSLKERPERTILSLEATPDFLRSQNDLEELLVWHQQKGPSFLG